MRDKQTWQVFHLSVALPSKLILIGSVGLDKVERQHGSYYRHQLYAAYVQGFVNYLSSTTRPYVAIGYTRSFSDVLNLGLNAGVGGHFDNCPQLL